MKKFYTFLLIVLIGSNALSQEAEELHETAKSFMRKGDYSNAALVLEKAILAEPENLEINKDLAVNYLVLKKNNKALELLLPFIKNSKADDQIYQLTANIYNTLDQRKDAEITFKKGIKKFPGSGALYNEYGEMLLSRQDLNAIKIWEKGIENDQQFAGNYYNATRFYNINTNRLWSVIYGEIFLLLEPESGRTPEIKNALLENYKKLLTEDDIVPNPKGKSPFEKALAQTLLKEKQVISFGINAESLTMLRTRFILDWNNLYKKKYPFVLFDIQTHMLEEGNFDAYNQWIFGTVQNLAAYQNWINVHPDEYSSFSNFQKGRTFKFPKGQYYH